MIIIVVVIIIVIIAERQRDDARRLAKMDNPAAGLENPQTDRISTLPSNRPGAGEGLQQAETALKTEQGLKVNVIWNRLKMLPISDSWERINIFQKQSKLK